MIDLIQYNKTGQNEDQEIRARTFRIRDERKVLTRVEIVP